MPDPTAPGVAIIGCGLIGQKRAKLLAPCRLVACADKVPERAAALAATAPGATAHADWRAALDQPGVGIVLVSTTHDQLPVVALAAAERGLHALIEKPAARRAAELDPVVAAAARTGARVRVGFNHRYHPALLKARELVAAGALGELMFCRARYGHGGRIGLRQGVAGRSRALRRRRADRPGRAPDRPRAPVARRQFTEVQGHAQTYYWDMPVDDNGFLLLRTARGQTAFLHASCTEWKNLFSFELYGRKGKLDISGLGGSYGVERLTWYQMLPEMGPPETEPGSTRAATDSWALEFADFLEDIRLGARSPSPGLRDAIAALRIVERIYELEPMIITRSPLRISLGGGGTDLPVLLPRPRRLPDRRRDRQVRLHHLAPDLRPTTSDRQVLEAGARRTAADEIEHPIIREAMRLVGHRRAAPRDHEHGRHPGGHRPRLLGQLHHRAAQGAAQPEEELHPPARPRRAGLPHRDRPAQGADRQAGPVHRRLRRPDLLPLPCPTARSRRGRSQVADDTLHQLEDNLLLFFTGYSRSASAVLKEQDDKSTQNDREMTAQPALRQAARPARARRRWRRATCTRFAELMNVHWEHKKKRSAA